MIPQIKERIPDLTPGEIAILYPAAFIGDDIANAAKITDMRWSRRY